MQNLKTSKNLILLDSSFLISLIIADDSNHMLAINMAKKIPTDANLIVTQYIYLECATVLARKTGKKIDLQEELKEIGVVVVLIPDSIFTDAMDHFEKLANKDISFVDLITALYASTDVKAKVASFDVHFHQLTRKFGFRVVSS